MICSVRPAQLDIVDRKTSRKYTHFSVYFSCVTLYCRGVNIDSSFDLVSRVLILTKLSLIVEGLVAGFDSRFYAFEGSVTISQMNVESLLRRRHQ